MARPNRCMGRSLARHTFEWVPSLRIPPPRLQLGTEGAMEKQSSTSPMPSAPLLVYSRRSQLTAAHLDRHQKVHGSRQNTCSEIRTVARLSATAVRKAAEHDAEARACICLRKTDNPCTLDGPTGCVNGMAAIVARALPTGRLRLRSSLRGKRPGGQKLRTKLAKTTERD